MNEGKRERQKKRKKERVRMCISVRGIEREKCKRWNRQRDRGYGPLKKVGDEKEKHKDKSVRRSEGEGGMREEKRR